MKPSLKLKTLAGLFLAGALALPTLADDPAKPDEKAAAPNEAQMMAMMMELAKPGENHKILEHFVGSWTYVSKFWMNPDPKAAPMQYSGSNVTKSIMGGRYFQSEVTGKMQMPGADGKMTDMDFHGMEVDGYDNAKKKFVSSWVDNMGTGIMLSEGSYDAATKTITYHSEYEPMPGVKAKVRETIEITDADHHKFTFYEEHDGQEVKTMEISYTRKS